MYTRLKHFNAKNGMKYAALLILLFAPSKAYAEWDFSYKTEILQRACEAAIAEEQSYLAGWCMGFVEGLLVMVREPRINNSVCIPTNVSIMQLAKIFGGVPVTGTSQFSQPDTAQNKGFCAFKKGMYPI
jgi:hypothetical protein